MYKALTALGLVVIAGIAYWFWTQTRQVTPPPPPLPAPVAAPPPVAPPKPEPVIQHPVASGRVAPEQPTLTDSDSLLKDAITRLFGKKSLREVFLDGIVRRIVATVDSLPREQVALEVWPVHPTRGDFLVKSEGAPAGEEQAVFTISPKNSERYAARVRLLVSVPPVKLVDFYIRHYPLFQSAYQDLGYPKGYFNDRLIEVIDHLLAAPQPAGPLLLHARRNRYVFVASELEELTAGEKILLRMGPQHAARVKTFLRAFRRALVE